MIKLKSLLKEEVVNDIDFVNNRMNGAAKITQNAKEKGGDALLTYHHFVVKLPYYEKAKNGEMDIDAAKKEFLETLAKISLDMDQTTFQTEVGRLEVLGELFINLLNPTILNEGVYDPGILKCIFLAGGPGSGKSRVAGTLFGVQGIASFSASGLKMINSDTAFEAQLKKSGIDPKDLGKIEKEQPELWDYITKSKEGPRETGKAITQKTKSFYEEGRLGMIIDGTGDDVAKIRKQKQRAEDLGYDTYMVFVNTSLEVAQARNAKRSRTLPEDLVTTIWKECQHNLGAFQTLFSGNFRIVDNTNDGDNITKDIQKEVDGFIRERLYNPIGKQWMTTALALKNANLIKK
jgi:predicted kinase